MQYIPYTEFVNDMVAKRDLYKTQDKDLLQTLAQKIADSIYGGNRRRDVLDQYKCVPKNWLKENSVSILKEWWPMKNDKLLDKLENDADIDDQDIAKTINQMPCHLGSYILSYSKRRLDVVSREIDGFYSNNFFSGDTDNAYFHKKHWATLVDKGFVGISLGTGKHDYGNSGIF